MDEQETTAAATVFDKTKSFVTRHRLAIAAIVVAGVAYVVVTRAQGAEVLETLTETIEP